MAQVDTTSSFPNVNKGRQPPSSAAGDGLEGKPDTRADQNDEVTDGTLTPRALEKFQELATADLPKIKASKLEVIEWGRLQRTDLKPKAGGQGKVEYMRLKPADDPTSDGRIVAVKFPFLNHIKSLTSEIESLSRIPAHDNVMRFEGVVLDQDLGIYAVIMPYANKGDLAAAIVDEKAPVTDEDFDRFVRRAIQICQGVQHLHTRRCQGENGEWRRFLHRDIKPSNILVFETEVRHQKYETLCLSDFGLAKAFDMNTKSARSQPYREGSAPYMAPEAWREERPSHSLSTDVYAIGATMWHMVVGKTPDQVYFMDSNDPDTPKAPHRENPACPKELNLLIFHCLAAKSEKRPSLADVIIELQKYRREKRDKEYKNMATISQTFSRLRNVADDIPDANGDIQDRNDVKQSRLLTALCRFDDKDDHQASDVPPTPEEIFDFYKGATDVNCKFETETIESAVELSRRLRRKRGKYADGSATVTAVVARLLGLDGEYADAFVIRLRLFIDGWGSDDSDPTGSVLTHHAVVNSAVIPSAMVMVVQSLLFLGFNVHLLTEEAGSRRQAVADGVPDPIVANFMSGTNVAHDVDLKKDSGACLVVETASLIPNPLPSTWRGYVGIFVVSSTEAAAAKVKLNGVPLEISTLMTGRA